MNPKNNEQQKERNPFDELRAEVAYMELIVRRRQLRKYYKKEMDLYKRMGKNIADTIFRLQEQGKNKEQIMVELELINPIKRRLWPFGR